MKYSFSLVQTLPSASLTVGLETFPPCQTMKLQFQGLSDRWSLLIRTHSSSTDKLEIIHLAEDHWHANVKASYSGVIAARLQSVSHARTAFNQLCERSHCRDTLKGESATKEKQKGECA